MDGLLCNTHVRQVECCWYPVVCAYSSEVFKCNWLHFNPCLSFLYQIPSKWDPYFFNWSITLPYLSKTQTLCSNCSTSQKHGCTPLAPVHASKTWPQPSCYLYITHLGCSFHLNSHKERWIEKDRQAQSPPYQQFTIHDRSPAHPQTSGSQIFANSSPGT